MGKEVIRNGKDTIWRMLFGYAENALSLYNALSGTAYEDSSLIEFNTLENEIYMNVKNDLLQNHVKDKSIYSSRLIAIPNPYFVVFYNGRRELTERMELKLSDAFEYPEADPALELKVTLLNINSGYNEDLKERCPILREYILYVQKVRMYTKQLGLADAVTRAVDECIQEGVLRDFLLRQKAEVVKMSIYEYDEERELQIIRADERELGREEERARTENALKSIVVLYYELEKTKEDAKLHLTEKCHLTEEEATERIEKYWCK